MAIDVALDPVTYDLALTHGDLVLLSGPDETTQHIKQRLLTFAGEWFLNLTIGVPWIQQILEKGRNLTIVESLLRNEIISTPGVAELTEFSINVESAADRTVRIDFSARLLDGSTVSDELEVAAP